MNNARLWRISLAIIGIITLILAVTKIAGIVLPDTVKRVLGLIELVTIPVLAYATVKRAQKK